MLKIGASARAALVRTCGAVLLLGLATAATAQPRPMEEGTHYERIDPPIATDTPEDVIEVLDVFWYGCPVCAEFEPMMSYYGGEVRGDVAMRRMPAIWNAAMRTHAQAYYTAVQLDVAAQAHPLLFQYLQQEHQPLNTQEQARAFFARLGIAAELFDTAWRSQQVADAVALAEHNTAAAGITRLPALVVNGRYRVVRNEGVPELPEVVVTANLLIKILRDERRTD